MTENLGRNRGNRAGAGPGGTCLCPECGETVYHITAVPCYTTTCPNCGAVMIRA